MELEEIRKILARHKEEVAKEFGICELGIFGSVAEGRAGRGSDIDLFYTMEEGRFLGLEQLEAFEERIRQILKRRKIDMVNLRYMNPIIRYRAEKHFVYV